MENKHVYLILAHNEFSILEKLIILLDDPRNDIYIHINKKVKDFDFAYFRKLPKKSNIYFVKQIIVSWGHYSQIEAELILLDEAIKKEYKYYHYISGVDLPIKPQNEIHRFFLENDGKEFVHFFSVEDSERAKYRVKYYHFIKWIKDKNKLISFLEHVLRKITYTIEDIFKLYRRWEKEIELRKGAHGFSITHDLAQYILSKKKWIKKRFKYTFCGDEIFLQTLVYNSNFKNNLYDKEMKDDYSACLRAVDWKRGEPYVYRVQDFYELINSNKFFARKFSAEIDNEIIIKIFEYINNLQNNQ